MSVSFQKHYSIPPPVSSPDLLFFGFCFLFFILKPRTPFRAGGAGGDFGRGREKFCIFMQSRYTFSAVWPSPALRATSPVNVGGSNLQVTFCLSRVRERWHGAQRHDGEGRCALLLPSQALRASSPGGRAKCTSVNRQKLCGKANFFVTLPYHKLCRD